MARRPAPPGADRRQQILDAALDVFAEQGYDAATTKDIAARADVTHGLIYFYFKNKEDLFAAACDYQTALVAEQIEHIERVGADASPEMALRHLITHLVRLLIAPRTLSLIRVMMRSSLIMPEGEKVDMEARERLYLFGRSLKDSVRSMLDSLVSRGALREIDVALASSMLLSATIHEMVTRAKTPESDAMDSAEELANHIADLFIFGLLNDTCRRGQEPPLPARSLARRR